MNVNQLFKNKRRAKLRVGLLIIIMNSRGSINEELGA